MPRRKRLEGRGQHPNSRANLVRGWQGERKFQGKPVSTRLSDELAERFEKAKGKLTDAEALRQAVDFALGQGWKGQKDG